MVEIDHLIVAGFSEVSGLSVETEVEEYREGGVNDFVHKLVKGTRHVPIVLKRGLTDSDVLWKWHNDVVQGKITRRSGSIILFNESYDEHRRWSFEEAYPIKWIGPDLNASSSEVAIEQLELAHNGFKIIK